MNVDNKERKEESRLTTRIHFSVQSDQLSLTLVTMTSLKKNEP